MCFNTFLLLAFGLKSTAKPGGAMLPLAPPLLPRSKTRGALLPLAPPHWRPCNNRFETDLRLFLNLYWEFVLTSRRMDSGGNNIITYNGGQGRLLQQKWCAALVKIRCDIKQSKNLLNLRKILFSLRKVFVWLYNFSITEKQRLCILYNEYGRIE